MRPLPLAVRRWLLAVPSVGCFLVGALTGNVPVITVGLLCALAWSWQTDARRPDSVRTPRRAP